MKPAIAAPLALALLVCFAMSPAAAAPKEPKLNASATFSDPAVREAIAKGVAYLLSTQKDDGSWVGHQADKYPAGGTALVVLALLEAGQNPQEARMKKALEFLQKTMDPNALPPADTKKDDKKDDDKPAGLLDHKTYSVSLRAAAWQAANRTTSNKYRNELQRDVELLVKSTKDGSYNYDCKGDGKSSGDNSNSQYGVYGVWSGIRGNIEEASIKEYWQKVWNHWLTAQSPSDGGWGYNDKDKTTATMVTAGVATMYLAFDALFSEGFAKCDQGPAVEAAQKPIKSGLDWLDKQFPNTLKPGVELGHGDIYYYLYGIERVGLAAGYKYFGTADWYKLGAERLMREQGVDGSFSGKYGKDCSTSWALLFLIRGQHAVLFNKLQYEGDWCNRPRDLASVTRWLGSTLETTLNWQIINLKVPTSEWHDAPVLYIAGSKKPNFTPEDIDKLREYVQQGGMIFTVTECGGNGFKAGIREIYRQLFPQYELTAMGPDHPLYKKAYKPMGDNPKFFHINNGIRTLAIHTDNDLPLSWQQSKFSTSRGDFDAVANLYQYVTDKGAIANRGVRTWPAEPTVEPKRTVTLARLKYAGAYNPEPLAMQRFSRLMLKETGTKVQVLEDVEIASLAEKKPLVATLTGAAAFTLSEDEKDALKKYVEAGGTLVIDAAGGADKFAESAERALNDMFGRNVTRRLAGSAELYQLTLGDTDLKIDQVRYRRFTRLRMTGGKEPNLRAVLMGTRPVVLFSREDLTCAGLVGYQSWECDGYDPGNGDVDPGSAFRLMRNIVLLAYKQANPAAASEPATKPASAPASKPAK